MMMQSEIKPATIFRHAFGVYPPLAMLAGMQLDVFTPLKGGPMTATALADAIGANAARLRPLLYALMVTAGSSVTLSARTQKCTSSGGQAVRTRKLSSLAEQATRNTRSWRKSSSDWM